MYLYIYHRYVHAYLYVYVTCRYIINFTFIRHLTSRTAVDCSTLANFQVGREQGTLKIIPPLTMFSVSCQIMFINQKIVVFVYKSPYNAN